MIVRRHRNRAAAIGALAAGILLAAAAPGQTQPPRADDCKELTGAERTRCEQRVADEDKARRRDDRGPTDQAHASPGKNRQASPGKKESSKDEAQPPSAPQNDAPRSEPDEAPPDTKSASDDHSDTADPPQD
jgi:hypothetical protein